MGDTLIKFLIVYELGEADHGGVTKHVAETRALNMHKAINNVWYRTGRNDTFRVLRAEVVQ